MAINIFVYILVVLFGSSSWLSTNAIWMELSLLTQTNPEGWSLPSYLAAAVQIACVGPLIYSVLHKCTRITLPKAPLIFTSLIFCSLCMLALAFCWDKTTYLFGAERSMPLIVLTFLMALVNATSNVLFLPYMAALHHSYLTAYFVGMSFSSLVPSSLKLIQGVSRYECKKLDNSTVLTPVYSDPLFHVRDYNLIMFSWLCMATASFAVLHWFYQDEARPYKPRQSKDHASDDEESLGHNANSGMVRTAADGVESIDEGIHTDQEEQRPLKENINGLKKDNGSIFVGNQETKEYSGRTRYWTLIACLAIICAEMNAIVPSVQSYATLSYSLLTYHLALTLNYLSHPLANFLPLWVKPKQLSVLVWLSVLCTALTTFIFVLALQSPTPMLKQWQFGGAIPVILSIVFGFLASYLRTHITGVVRGEHPDNEARLFWCGVFMQIGSFIGAFLMFPMVNVWQVFQKAPPCP